MFNEEFRNLCGVASWRKINFFIESDRPQKKNINNKRKSNEN
jgi:hypothetical protein